MSFTHAIYKNPITGMEELLSSEQIKDHSNFQEVRETLYCPEEGCSARLIYTERLPKGFLRAISIHHHSEGCWHHTDKVKERRIAKEILANGPLTEKGINHRKNSLHKYVINYLFPVKKSDSNSTTTKKRKKQPITQSSTDSDNLIIKIDPTNSQDVSETDFDLTKHKRKEPTYYTYQIDELTEKHSNKNIKTFAVFNHVNTSKDTTHLATKFNNINAKFILTEDFFADINKDQILTFLMDIADYSKTHEVLLETLCESYTINPKAIKLYIHNSNNIAFFIDGKFFKTITHAASYINHNKRKSVH
ncbi:hypothetical protein [Vagococcus fluvialis]|uniref:hypothetical protein n=1 Tax=Vagococcus fluvialis TaxID=2738 RepID=UPI0037A12D34